MQTEDKLKHLLSDLGRSTLRGIRQCPNCGNYSGTRGYCCKNKACGFLFREPSDKVKHSMDACKLDTGSSTRVYSVKVREKGPENRGFVQLPVDTTDSFPPTLAAVCFVDSCQKLFQSNILKCHDEEEPLANCSHIQSAMRCHIEAQPLFFTQKYLRPLCLPQSLADELKKISEDTPGPLVQRVSKSVFAVKCRTTTKYPLGFLHVSLSPSKIDFFQCPCLAKLGNGSSSCKTSNATSSAQLIQPLEKTKCVHYYACVATIMNQVKLMAEFTFLPEISNHLMDCALQLPSNVVDDDTIFGTDISQNVDSSGGTLEELLGEAVAAAGRSEDDVIVANSLASEDTSESTAVGVGKRSSLSGHSSPDKDIEVNDDLKIDRVCSLDGAGIEESGPDVTSANDLSSQLLLHQDISSDLLGIENCAVELPVAGANDDNTMFNLWSFLRIQPQQKKPKAMKRKADSYLVKSESASKKSEGMPLFKGSKDVNPDLVSQSFIEWLSSVTERINQTMHFQFSGKPDPLVFHVPHVFFDCLIERLISTANQQKRKKLPNLVRRKRLPNLVTRFIRKHAPPIGKFYNYTWHITNIKHAKAVFDTPMMKLNLTRSFIENPDGNFVDFDPSIAENDLTAVSLGKPPIRPTTYKTYLKIVADQATPSILSIDWTPDVLPISKIGELKITFEYGHTPQLAASKILKLNSDSI